ncbi:FHA domain-containing protein [Rubinisphaera margarita]|uniref:FHA domain-containing protein n=1 Tax=Rubinisphaera margarita TaxID=2909586 RepID=UPI001EE87CF3|nr:FHA domain-containing protein [Rubinisphaera margarita]MCG6158589.1 FHA domain-containing protein [Rubinisphaera margarita]
MSLSLNSPAVASERIACYAAEPLETSLRMKTATRPPARITSVSLTILTGTLRGQTITATGPRFLIGSGLQCQLQITSPGIATVHAALLLDGYTVRVRDMGCLGGTKVNGEMIANDRWLEPDDHVELGHTLIKIGYAK